MSDRPLVVHVVLSLDPGGLERLVCNLAAAPGLSGFRVLVCCLDREGALAEEVRRAGHRVLLVPRAGGTDPGLVLRLSRVFRDERPAVVHTHNLDAMLYAGWAAVLAGVPVRVHTQHNTLLTAGYGWQERLKFRLALPAFRHVVAVSQQTARQFEVMGVPAARRVLVRNGVDQGTFQSHHTPAAPPPSEIVVGAVGRLSPEKGLHRLLEAFALVRTDGTALRLDVVGDGPERGRLEELARQSGIGERVTFLGFRERVHEILPGFQIFVLPSLTEGIPLALLEAMSAGLACIATRVGGVPEVIEDGVNGVLVPGDDPGALARAIEALAADPARRARLGEAARTHAAREWSEGAMARRYRALYRADAPDSHLRRLVKAASRILPRRWMCWEGSGRRAEVALTFDDGPDATYTPGILDALGAHGIRATFFLIGENAEREPALLERMVREGHELGNHSYTHPHFEGLSWAEALGEIDRTETILDRAQPGRSGLWRPPRGKLCRTSLLGAWRRGLRLVMWSVDVKDFRAEDAADIEDCLQARPLQPGDIVLYHGHNPAALAALPRLIEAARRAGLSPVPVSRLLGR